MFSPYLSFSPSQTHNCQYSRPSVFFSANRQFFQSLPYTIAPLFPDGLMAAVHRAPRLNSLQDISVLMLSAPHMLPAQYGQRGAHH